MDYFSNVFYDTGPLAGIALHQLYVDATVPKESRGFWKGAKTTASVVQEVARQIGADRGELVDALSGIRIGLEEWQYESLSRLADMWEKGRLKLRGACGLFTKTPECREILEKCSPGMSPADRSLVAAALRRARRGETSIVVTGDLHVAECVKKLAEPRLCVFYVYRPEAVPPGIRRDADSVRH